MTKERSAVARASRAFSRLEELEPERMKAAIRTGCNAADIHLVCSYPECRCKAAPVAIKAGIAGWLGSDGRDKEMR